ncbi:MAG: hypothetical protein NWF06_03215 [Candidatus Bathyarchaeota archaeon]|nr:hypothetical protein [Candidatus Bathyarchaeum sp.]
MPKKDYNSVNIPCGLYEKVREVVGARADLGYRSITEFVVESVRHRVEELNKSTQ